MGATAGRTTLNGEGLQHEDGHSHLLASTIPPLRAYDPAFAYELAAIVRDGIERMYGRGEDVFYYVTLYNENYPQPPKPDGVDEAIVRGLYRFLRGARTSRAARRAASASSGSGSILQQVLAARDLLAERFGVAAEVYSATSFQLLRRDALEVERWNRLHPTEAPRVPYVAEVLGPDGGPVVLRLGLDEGAAGHGRRAGCRAGYVALGTDGFGRSDTREALRALFEIDAPHVAVAALSALRAAGELPAERGRRGDRSARDRPRQARPARPVAGEGPAGERVVADEPRARAPRRRRGAAGSPGPAGQRPARSSAPPCASA